MVYVTWRFCRFWNICALQLMFNTSHSVTNAGASYLPKKMMVMRLSFAKWGRRNNHSWKEVRAVPSKTNDLPIVVLLPQLLYHLNELWGVEYYVFKQYRHCFLNLSCLICLCKCQAECRHLAICTVLFKKIANALQMDSMQVFSGFHTFIRGMCFKQRL